MNTKLNEMNKKLHERIDEGLAKVKKVKNQLQDFQIDIDVVTSEKLKAARDLFADNKLEAYAAKTRLEELLEEKKEETEIAVAGWKLKHDKKKLEKRAERAEKYAVGCITHALY